MENKKVWLITGASRGLGLDITKAALAAGHQVIATGRNPEKLLLSIGAHNNLLTVKLDITFPVEAESAVKTGIEKFGRIDVLVNNAANFYAGYFEELTPDQMESQLVTSLIGPMNVTRAVLPLMREQQSGHIITISSTAGLVGFEFGSAYSASKFAIEGWMESLETEIAPFGIQTTIVNPGFFRTELLTEESTNFASPFISDYDERRAQQIVFWKGANGQQPGDPKKLANAIIILAKLESPPKRFIAGSDAIATAENVIARLQQEINAYRELSSSMAIDGA